MRPPQPPRLAAEGASQASAGSRGCSARALERVLGQRVTRQELGLIALTSLLLLLYVGAEVTFGGFALTYAVEARGMSEGAAQYLTAAFWGALAVGRLLAVPQSTRQSPARMLGLDMLGCLIACAVLGASALGGGWGGKGVVDVDVDVDATEASGGPMHGTDAEREGWRTALLWLASCLMGLSMASVFPTAITHAEEGIMVSGRVAAVFVVGAAVGEMLVPVITSSLIGTVGATAFAVTMAAVLVGATAAVIVLRAVAGRLPRYAVAQARWRSRPSAGKR